MRRTQDRESVSQAVDRIRQFVQREPGVRLTALLHHITVDALRWAFFEMKKNAAAGVEEGLEGRLADLHDRVHSGAYRARPSRRVNIPKPDRGTRLIGVAAIEDKIVQKTVAETILTPIYEAEFLGFSYGFRPGRGTHNALDALAVGMRWRKIAWVVDCDIRAFFDTISRSWLVRLLEHRIGDRRVIRLIVKWLNAGVMDAEEWRDDLRGTPQGSVISPILANVYLHYVLDLWFQKKWRSHEVKGDTIIVLYADDFVVGFQHKRDAERFLDAVKERFGSFELELGRLCGVGLGGKLGRAARIGRLAHLVVHRGPGSAGRRGAGKLFATRWSTYRLRTLRRDLAAPDASELDGAARCSFLALQRFGCGSARRPERHDRSGRCVEAHRAHNA